MPDHFPVHGHAGIGKSIARKLAAQGLNVVLVALQDEVLDATTRELKKAFPKTLLRKVRSPAGDSSDEP